MTYKIWWFLISDFFFSDFFFSDFDFDFGLRILILDYFYIKNSQLLFQSVFFEFLVMKTAFWALILNFFTLISDLWMSHFYCSTLNLDLDFRTLNSGLGFLEFYFWTLISDFSILSSVFWVSNFGLMILDLGSWDLVFWIFDFEL